MTAPRPPLRLGPRKRLARWLRWVASKLDDQRRPPGRAHLSAVADDRRGRGHAGAGGLHECRCDSYQLPPALRGQPHGCRCLDGPEEQSHLPAGASYTTGGALRPGQLTINEAPPAWPEGEIVRRRGHGASEGDYLL